MTVYDRAIGPDTEELPAIARDYCRKCGAYSWGPAAPMFVCMDCGRFNTRSAPD